ncbi:MAG: hypothetical protein IIT42_03365, partial [Clostridia bacterium]|nr:hypothetical protein [Clostridia bacterium]
LYFRGSSGSCVFERPTSFYAFSSAPTMVYKSEFGGYVPVFGSGSTQIQQYKGLSNFTIRSYIIMT